MCCRALGKAEFQQSPPWCWKWTLRVSSLGKGCLSLTVGRVLWTPGTDCHVAVYRVTSVGVCAGMEVFIQGVHFTVPVSTAALVGAFSLRNLPASARNLVDFCPAVHCTLFQSVISNCSKSWLM
jgi:hypothetical protein